MVENELRRNKENQLIHDWVIEKTTEIFLEELNVVVYMNQDLEKIRTIKGKYPDIVVYKTKKDDDNNKPKIIAEIETTDTIDKYEAEKQWVPYAELSVPIFYLFVPKERLSEAQELIEDFDITDEIDLYKYKIDEFKNIIFY